VRTRESVERAGSCTTILREARFQFEAKNYIPFYGTQQAQIGSLVFGASYAAAASGAITEAAKVVYPVLGATGVFKRAK
jgi:hypothetical protein